MAHPINFPKPHQVALVGGTNVSSFQTHMEEWGVDVCVHVPYLPLRVPKQATALVVLKTHCSHELFHTAQKVAQKRKLMLVTVEQNWAQAEPLLQKHGILPTPNTETPNPVKTEPDHKEGRLYQLQSQVVRLENHLRQAENMILERDDQVLRMEKRMDSLGACLERLKDKLDTSVPYIFEMMGNPWARTGNANQNSN